MRALLSGNFYRYFLRRDRQLQIPHEMLVSGHVARPRSCILYICIALLCMLIVSVMHMKVKSSFWDLLCLFIVYMLIPLPAEILALIFLFMLLYGIYRLYVHFGVFEALFPEFCRKSRQIWQEVEQWFESVAELFPVMHMKIKSPFWKLLGLFIAGLLLSMKLEKVGIVIEPLDVLLGLTCLFLPFYGIYRLHVYFRVKEVLFGDD